MVSTWEEFYAKTPAPTDLPQSQSAMHEFVQLHLKENNKVALVTSGGTTIPLECNAVRYLENFSAGTRGSVSAEYFLEHGYAVIFLFRLKSLEPFSRHFTGQKFLDMLDLTESDGKRLATVSSEYSSKLAAILYKYREASRQKRLLQVSFTTVGDYLWLLRAACQELAPLKKNALLYLAAAVSDFYIPPNEMSVHKLPSSGPPTLSLQLIPKVLEPLVSLWVPDAFVVSFKLETDEKLLITNARKALNKYKHKLVIANILQTRKQHVVLVSEKNDYIISLTDEQMKHDEEIEKDIVAYLAERHKEFILLSTVNFAIH